MVRRLLAFCLLSTLTLGACSADVSPTEQARIDAAKIADVERANIIPPNPVSPEKILYPDYEANDLFGAGCAFAPKDEGLGAIALTQNEVAYLKLDGKIVRFVADKGSKKAPFATWETYDGKSHSIRLDFARGNGRASGSQTVSYTAKLSIRNGRGQTIYQTEGTAQCGF